MKKIFKQLVLFSVLGVVLLNAYSSEVTLLRNRKVEERPQLLLLGAPHFANYGRDVLNLNSPDVLSAQRQQEILAITNALRRFQPNKIIVEVDVSQQTQLDERYQAYREGKLDLEKSEVHQIGFRLARQLNHPRVFAVDWNDMPPGEVADFDYEVWAEKNHAEDRLQAMRDPKATQTHSAWMARQSVLEWLIFENTSQVLNKKHRDYFDYALLGGKEKNPGANWLGNWYARNFKIFANVVRLADRPSDRILLIYGAGHMSLLRQFAEQSGAFQVQDVLPYLIEERTQ